MKYNKLLTISLISTMTAATLMFTGCGEDKKTTAENTKVEKTQKEDTSNEDTSNETTASEEVRYTEDGYRIVDTINGDYSDVGVGEIVFDDKEGIYKQYEGDGCWMRNPFDDYDIALKPAPSGPVPLDHSRGNVEDKIAYQQAYEEAKASGLFDSLQ